MGTNEQENMYGHTGRLMEFKKHFMVDIETTGVSRNDQVLQIGLLECTWDGTFWKPGRSLEQLLWTDKTPQSAFAKEYMGDLYKRCQQAPVVYPWQVRTRLVQFFELCGCFGPDNVYFMGRNAGMFDVPMLTEKGFLRASGYITIDGKDHRVGDYHHRIFELTGAIQMAACVRSTHPKEIETQALENNPYKIELEGNPHDALYDCYHQLNVLNGLIRMLRVNW